MTIEHLLGSGTLRIIWYHWHAAATTGSALNYFGSQCCSCCPHSGLVRSNVWISPVSTVPEPVSWDPAVLLFMVISESVMQSPVSDRPFDHRFVYPLLSFEPTDLWPWSFQFFCLRVGHDYGSQGIEGQGQVSYAVGVTLIKGSSFPSVESTHRGYNPFCHSINLGYPYVRIGMKNGIQI